MSDLTLPKETIVLLKERHIAFLEKRLRDERVKAEWAQVNQAAFAHLFSCRVNAIVDLDGTTNALRAVLSSKELEAIFIPIANDIHRRVLASMRTDGAKLGEFVPAEARASIDVLLSRKDIIPEAIVRKIFDEEAIEEVLAAVLYDGLKEFNETVNPFFADWGLPGLIKRVVPIGSGTVMKAIDAVRGEFDKRLDPEMRKFLAAFTRRAKGKLADLVVAKNGDPHFVALRRNVAVFLYEQTLVSLLAGVDDASATEVEKATSLVIRKSIDRDASWERVRVSLGAFLEEHGEKTVGDWLATFGVNAPPSVDVWAEFTWPYARLVIESPYVREQLVRLTNEFYDEIGEA